MKYLFIFAILSTFLNASVTMCYKNNHDDPSTIENIALDGGECKGEYSILKMKENGWIVDDMKLSIKDGASNYIYILKKGDSQEVKFDESKIDYKKLAANVKKEEERQEEVNLIKRGEVFYSKTCITCHGQKGEVAQKQTRAINTLTLEEMESSLYDYQWDEVDSKYARIMKPYAELIVEQDIEAVHKYLQSIKE